MDDALRRTIETALRGRLLDEAARLCHDALDRGVSLDFLRLTLARIAFVQNRPAQALHWLATLLRTRTDDATWLAAGTLYEELGRRTAALRCYQRACHDHPTPHALRRLIELRRILGESEEASRLRDEVLLTRWPADPWGRQDLAGERFADGRLDEARELYATLPTAYDAWASAEIHLRQGDDEAALRWCHEAVARGAHLPWPHYRAAQILVRRGEVGRARALLAQAPGRQAPDPLAEYERHLGERRAPPPALQSALALDGAAAVESRVRERVAQVDAAARHLGITPTDGHDSPGRGVVHRFVLHGYKDRHGWRRLAVRPVIYQVGDVPLTSCRASVHAYLTALEAFHRRTYAHGDGFTVASAVACAGSHDYTWFRDAIEHQGFRALARALGVSQRRRHEVILVFWCGGARLAEGYGGYGHAVLSVAPGDVYAETVLTHEFYHAVLGLQHTDGDKDVLDAGGIMGYPGGLNRLTDTYVIDRQRALCVTDAHSRRLARRGHRHEEAREWDEAAACYRAVLARDPLYVWVGARLAQVEVHRGREAAACEVLTRLMWVDDAPEHRAQLAHIQLDLGRAGEAARTLASMVASERTCLLSGFTWSMSWYFPRALAAFRRARSFRADSHAAMAGVADVLFALGRLDAARVAYTHLLARVPHWSETWDRLAVLEASAGHLATAGQHLRRAGGLKKGGGIHHHARARVLAWSGRWPEALDAVRRSLDEEPHTMGALLFEAWIAHLLRRPEARDLFVRCRDSERHAPWGRVAAAWVDIIDDRHASFGRHRNALRRLYRRDPRLGSLLHARVWLESGEVREQCTSQLRRIEPTLPPSLPLPLL